MANQVSNVSSTVPAVPPAVKELPQTTKQPRRQSCQRSKAAILKQQYCRYHGLYHGPRHSPLQLQAQKRAANEAQAAAEKRQKLVDLDAEPIAIIDNFIAFLNYELRHKFSLDEKSLILLYSLPNDVLRWHKLHVRDFIEALGFPDAAKIFVKERIDGISMMCLTRRDIMVELASSLRLGPALKVFGTILRLQQHFLHDLNQEMYSIYSSGKKVAEGAETSAGHPS